VLATFLITLREGLEAALVAGLVAGILRRRGHVEWLPLVWIGVASAALICLGVGLALDLLSVELPQRQQELFEAAAGAVAVTMMTVMAFWMRRAGRGMQGQLQGQVQQALDARSGLALILLVFLAVAREGLELVFFLLALAQQSTGWQVLGSALSGLLVAVLAGLAIAWGGLRLNLARFFHWTGIVILLAAAGIAAGSLRALHEAGWWNGLQQLAFDLSPVLPADGVVGSVLAGLFGYVDQPSLGEVLIYLLFLLATLPAFLAPARQPAEARG
jgi:high-affinity iron transporter